MYYPYHVCIYTEILVYIKSNLNLLTTNSGIHSYNTRKIDDLFIVTCNASLCKNNFNNIGVRMLNHLPRYIKEIPVLYKFKNALKHSYSIVAFTVQMSFSCLQKSLSSRHSYSKNKLTFRLLNISTNHGNAYCSVLLIIPGIKTPHIREISAWGTSTKIENRKVFCAKTAGLVY
jgi:hypothetical protein